jgi:hypothetical protein
MSIQEKFDYIMDHLDRGFTIWVVGRNKEVLEGLRHRLEESVVELDRLAFRPFR